LEVLVGGISVCPRGVNTNSSYCHFSVLERLFISPLDGDYFIG